MPVCDSVPLTMTKIQGCFTCNHSKSIYTSLGSSFSAGSGSWAFSGSGSCGFSGGGGILAPRLKKQGKRKFPYAL